MELVAISVESLRCIHQHLESADRLTRKILSPQSAKSVPALALVYRNFDRDQDPAVASVVSADSPLGSKPLANPGTSLVSWCGQA